MIKRCYASPERRLRQLERCFLIIELLSPLRHGATIGELTSDVGDALGSAYCERTIRRDLEALEMLGVVESVRTNEVNRAGGRVASRWRWVDRSVRSAVFSHVAAVRAEEREPWPQNASDHCSIH